MVTRPDRGRPTLLWLVGPRRAAHIKGGGGPHGSSTKVRRHHPPPTDLTLTRSRERSGDGMFCRRHLSDAPLRPRRRPVPLATRRSPTPTPNLAATGCPLLQPGVRRRHHRHDYTEHQHLHPAASRRRIWSTPTPFSHSYTRDRKEHEIYLLLYHQNMYPCPNYEHRARFFCKLKNFRTLTMASEADLVPRLGAFG